VLNVAIAIDAPTDLGPDAAAVVAAACEEVIGAGRCPIAADLPRGAVAAWFALVHSDDGALSTVQIDFRDRSEGGVLIERRTLAFTGNEDRRTRLVSIGSVIAALAAAREGSLVPLPPPRPLSPPPEPVQFGFDVAGLVTPALGGGVVRGGGLARANLELDAPLLFSAGAEYSARPGEPSFGWWGAFVGVGTRVFPRTARFRIELRGEFVFERVSVSARSGSAQDSGSENEFGGRIEATLVWRPWRASPWLSLVGGASGTLVSPGVTVLVGSGAPMTIPPATCGFFIGFRILP
jgi:hypothetical protein